MSQFRIAVANGIFISNPWFRTFKVQHKSILQLQSLVVGAGAGTGRKSQFINNYNGLCRSIHSSTTTVGHDTAAGGGIVGTGSSSLNEINVEPISRGVEELFQDVGTTDVHAPPTLEAPSASVGFLFSDSPPVLASQDLLYQIKDLPGMEWTTTIVLTTIGVRLLIGLPISITQQKSMGKLQALQPEIKALVTDLARETAIAVKLYSWDKKRANSAFKRSYKKHWRNLMEMHNCHPMRAVSLGLLQIPFWVCLSGAIRNVVYCLPAPATDEMLARWSQIAAESTPWFISLADIDSVVFPLIFLTANLLNIQLNSLRSLTLPQTTLQKVVPWVFRICVTGVAIFAMFTPAAVTMYWATSSVLALLVNLLLRMNRFRRLFGLLPIPKP